MKTNDLNDYARKVYAKSGVLRNEFKTFDDINQMILSGHQVKYANENYDVVIVNNQQLKVLCNLNGFESNLEECEIQACYSK